jgi:hypothetical protein
MIDLFFVPFLDTLAGPTTEFEEWLTPSAVVLEIHLVTTFG